MTKQPRLPSHPCAPVPSLFRTVSSLALIAGSVGLVGFASPASAQCVEGPPNSFNCAGQTVSPQLLNGANPAVITTAGFGVNTTGNGNGLALQVVGTGEVSYTDLQASTLIGAGVHFSTTGAVGATPGSLVIFSDGAIGANGAQGLRLDNAGGGDTSVFWSGSISNIAGNGVFFRNVAGSSGAASLSVGQVIGRDDGIRIDFGGAGPLAVTASGPILGITGAGLRIAGTSQGGDYDIDVGQVTGGAAGIDIDNNGTGSTRVVASGLVTGQTDAGIVIDTGANAGGVIVDVAGVAGANDGIHIDHFGTGDVHVQASELVAASAGAAIDIGTGTGAGSVAVYAGDLTGGSGVAINHQGSLGASVTTTGTVIGNTGTGIFVENEAGATDIAVDATGDVFGGQVGIGVHNEGTSWTLVLTTGAVAGGEIGLDASVGASGTDLTIQVSDVSGGEVGVLVENDGIGFTSIRSNGAVVGGDFGIDVSAAASATNMLIDVGDVTGGKTGIDVENLGTGFTSIRSTGDVTGTGSHGIRVETGAGSQGVLIRAVDVTGATGIRLDSRGAGSSAIVAAGAVVGTEGFGVEALNDVGTADLILDLQTVRGAFGGVFALNAGTGQTVVTTEGTVVGEDGDGLLVDSGSATTGVAVQTAGVTGRNNGVSVANSGLGATQVILGGTTAAAIEDGLNLFNGAQTTGLSVLGGHVEGAGYGVFGQNFGGGETSLVFLGQITGWTRDGLRIVHAGAGGSLDVDVVDVSGAETAVVARNEGGGDLDLTLRGLITGGGMGVEAVANPGADLSITNFGNVRRLSGQSSEAILIARGGRVDILNTGTITGSLQINGGSSLFVNEGDWNAAGGTNFFSGADDRVSNTGSGLILLGNDAALVQSTVWSGLEQFDNSGTISFADGASGDSVRTVANTSFQDGSVLAVDIGGAGDADLYQTFGAAEIEAGSVLAINIAGGLKLHERYVVVQAAGGLSGEFEFEDVALSAFAGLRDGYTGTTAFVEFAQFRPLAEAGITPNQKQAAGGADSLPDGDALKDALILLPDDAAAIDAFDQISGEIHPSARTTVVEDSRLLRNAVLDRLSDGEPAGAVWGRAWGNAGLSDGDFNAAKVDRDTRGVIIGVDRSIGPVTLGVAGGWSDTDLSISRRDSEGAVESLHGVVYGGTRIGGWGLRGGVGYAQTSLKTERRIAFPGLSATPTAAYDGAVMQGFVETGYRMPLGGGFVEPFASVAVARAKTDAFREVDGPAALNVEEARETSTISTLGLRFETNRHGAFSLRGNAGWRHSFGDLAPSNQHAFDGGAPFTILGTAQSEDAAVARVEARWQVSPRVSLGVAYDGVLGTDGEDHAITGGVRFVF